MGEVLIIGGGIVGMATAQLLAADGHRVTVLERDPAPPPATGDEAWDGWERRGVNQFRMIHYFLPRFRQVVEAELPAVAEALDADGVLRLNPVLDAPEAITGGRRPGDERFEAMTGRRPMVEAAFGRVTEATPGVEVRRGVAVAGLLTADGGAAVPHVVGVVTESGEELRADLVVDVAGRRSALPRLLTDVGARAPLEEKDDSGFVYYGRYFRSADGSVPPALSAILEPYESVSTLTLPADNGTWGLGLVTSAGDAELRAAKDPAVWETVIGAYPLAAHWLDGEPISDVAVMAKIEDRIRAFVVDGTPVATGVVALGDSWACTNPSVGRGATIGLLHALALRDVLRAHGLGDAAGLALAFDEATRETVEPLYRDTLAFDRHRLAEIEAQIAGHPYETDDPTWLFADALSRAARLDPDVFRGYVDVASLLERGVEVLARPGLAERTIELASGPIEPAPGPSRAELVELVRSA